MTWLIIQIVAWCLIGFAVGALAAWLLAVMLFPHERQVLAAGAPRVEANAADEAKGLDA